MEYKETNQHRIPDLIKSRILRVRLLFACQWSEIDSSRQLLLYAKYPCPNRVRHCRQDRQYLQSVFESGLGCFYSGNSPSTSAVMMKRTNIGSAYFIKVFR